MAMVASFSTQGFIYLHVAAGEIKLQNIGETTEKATAKNRALTPLTCSPNYRGWSVLGCRRMCLAQHHCDNNPGIMSSVLQMTGLSNMSTSHPRHHHHSHRSFITILYRVSHITGPTLFLPFSQVLEHLQRNFSLPSDSPRNFDSETHLTFHFK